MRKMTIGALLATGAICATPAQASTKSDIALLKRQVAKLTVRVTRAELAEQQTKTYADGIISCLFTMPVNPIQVSIQGSPFTLFELEQEQHPLSRLVFADEFCLDGQAWREIHPANHGFFSRSEWLAHPPRVPRP